MDLKTQTLRWLWSELQSLGTENRELMNALADEGVAEAEAEQMVLKLEERLRELSARVTFESKYH